VRTIHKYALRVTDSQQVSMPQGAEIVAVQVQSGVLTAWAIVDTEAALQTKELIVVGTGNPYPAPAMGTFHKHLSTVQMGAYVWHVFEVVRG